MQVRIRKARPGDFEALCALFEQLDELHRLRLPHIFRRPSGGNRERSYVQGLLEDPQGCFLIAEVGRVVVGFAYALLRDTPPVDVFIPARSAVVDSLCVNPRFQGRGLGRMLMEAIETWAGEAGADYLELNVYEFNRPAVRFYEGLGYATISRRMRKDLHNTG